MTSVLAQPLPLPCGVVLKNRLAKSAMSERLAGPDHAPHEAHTTLYRRWAEGGVGLCITGNVMIDPARRGEAGNVAVTADRPDERWSAWASAAGGHDTACWVQLNHPGRQAPRTLDPEPVAPSAVGMRGSYGTFAVPRALGEGEIEEIVARFGRAAAFAKDSGFGGVQLHAAHGYLVSQFLSPLTNQRADRFGGALAGRMTFLLEVVRAIRAAVGPAFPVGVKLNTADFQRGGFGEDEALEVASALEAERIDLLELSGGTYERSVMFSEQRPSTASREAFFLEQAERIRQRVATPLLLTGGFRTRGAMEEAVRGGAVDMVGLARPLAVEPDLPARLLQGQCDGAVPIRLHTGLSSLDAVITGGWYQVQIERLANGLPADASVSRWSAVSWYVKDLLRGQRVARGLSA
jgi:2,4-dienoyl-CoA reductase-like NADH-dependent reductase (Old Yellow Enzyme family)